MLPRRMATLRDQRDQSHVLKLRMLMQKGNGLTVNISHHRIHHLQPAF